jgi:hypothetical protein
LLRILCLQNMTGHIMLEIPVLFCSGTTNQSRESSKTVGLQEKHHKLCTHLLGLGWKRPIFHQWIHFNTEPAQCTTQVRKFGCKWCDLTVTCATVLLSALSFSSELHSRDPLC